MRVLLARVKLLEPLMLRGPGEFDPSSRGVYSYALSLPMPRPSTVLGALMSGQRSCKLTAPESFKGLLKFYEDALDCMGIEAIRGFHSYSRRSNRVYVPLLMGFKRPVLIDYEVIEGIEANILDYLIESRADGGLPSDFMERVKKLEELVGKETLKLKVQERVGIALGARAREASKTAREGYIYTTKYLSYADPTVEVRFHLIQKKDREMVIPREVDLALKLGGEQRITAMRVEEGKDKITERLLKFKGGEHKYLLLTTPAPINLKDFNRIPAYIGRINIIGLGYSLAHKKRKPLYPALMEGTIVKAGKVGEEALRYGIYAVMGLHEDEEYRALGRIGYGTVIPITPP